MQVNSPQNMELLWTTLQESGAFAGLSKDQFQPVKAAFETSVHQAAAAPGSLSDINKSIIRNFMQMLRTFHAPEKKKKIELIYRAEDLQSERASEFDRQLREKQAEMDSFLTLKKPTDVSFSDKEKGIADDKPIGDEMSRLIAQELAARERELVQLKPEDIKRAQQWIGVTNATNTNNTNNAPNPTKKTVSVSEEKDEEKEDEEEREDTDSILSKFKTIQVTPNPSQIQMLNDPDSEIKDLHDKIVKLEQLINANHAEVMAFLQSLK